MKYILLTICSLMGALTASAGINDRFQYQGLWFEPTGNGECRTAAAENMSIVEEEYSYWDNDPSDNWAWKEFHGVRTVLTGGIDPAIIQDNSKNWIVNNAIAVGPNWTTNVSTVVIPEKAKDSKGNEYIVTAIGDFSFAISYKQSNEAPSVNEFVLPSTLKSIGTGSFFGYSNLSKLELPDGLEEIGASAFENCKNIQSLNIPGSVKNIEARAFYNVSNLKSLTFNEGLEYIGDSAFENCSAIDQTVKFPDSLKEIGARAFKECESIPHLIFGNGLEKVGDEAFLYVDEKINDVFLPASLTDIGHNAFNFQTNGSNFTDLYYPNMDPSDIEGDAFGLVDQYDENKWNKDYFIYATVCLHVPVGTIDLYRSKNGWKYFKCIIDDIVPQDPSAGEHTDPDDPLTYILDYLYLVPGDDIDLNTLIGETPETFKWYEIPEDENDERAAVLTLNPDGTGKAKAYGNVIAIGKRIAQKMNPDGSIVTVDAPVGAVIIFVCPTLTVVYDKDNTTDTPGVKSSKAPLKSAYSMTESSEEDPAMLQSSNTTYSHPVVFNSFPKVQINPTPEIIIEKIERASLDQSKENYIEGTGLSTVNPELQETSVDYIGVGYEGSVVPEHPVAENRLIVVSLTVPYGIATEVEQIEIDHKISVKTSQHHLSIVGADENSQVNLVNLNGQVIYNGTHKDFELEPGIYIVSVEDATFKAIVK